MPCVSCASSYRLRDTSAKNKRNEIKHMKVVNKVIKCQFIIDTLACIKICRLNDENLQS